MDTLRRKVWIDRPTPCAETGPKLPCGMSDVPKPLLFTYRRCPYAMRARMALLIARIPFHAFEISLREKPAEMLALSPKGTVPILQLPDGCVIDQSWDIVRWALESNDQAGWWSRSQTRQNVELLDCNDGRFKLHLDRYKYPERFKQTQPDLDKKVNREHAINALLLPLEDRLAQQGFLGGDAPCAADIGIFPFVRQFAAVEPDWFAQQSLPALRAWLVQWMSSALFAACMAKLPVREISAFPVQAGAGTKVLASSAASVN